MLALYLDEDSMDQSLVLHTQYLTEGKSHRGIILAPQQRYSIGEQLRQILDLISVKTIEQMENNVEFIKG